MTLYFPESDISLSEAIVGNYADWIGTPTEEEGGLSTPVIDAVHNLTYVDVTAVGGHTGGGGGEDEEEAVVIDPCIDEDTDDGGATTTPTATTTDSSSSSGGGRSSGSRLSTPTMAPLTTGFVNTPIRVTPEVIATQVGVVRGKLVEVLVEQLKLLQLELIAQLQAKIDNLQN